MRSSFSSLLSSNKFFRFLVGFFVFSISGCIAASNYLKLEYSDNNGSVEVNFTKRDLNVTVGELK
ncbi:hypothetical protein FNP13_08450 [Campylobacter jejuni]|nr:hypothetical protein [Campylobacter jejuni]